jgi:hypothetical protein
MDKLKQTASVYHALPSVFWSALNLVPISIYCYQFSDRSLLYWILGLSFLSYLLPKTFFNRIQLSKNVIFYKKLGVKLVRKFAQEGDLVNQMIRRKYPAYKIIQTPKSVSNYISKTYGSEKFHFHLFLIFLSISIIAIINREYGWAALITLNNIIFNVYPNLLQQYNRIRLKKLEKNQ